MINIQIREAQEADVPSIRDLFTKCYGPHYRYQDFYDDYWLKKTVYSDNYLFLVATDGDVVLGSASVYFDTGSYTDLLGEFGRLVVNPDYRERGIGSMLMRERIRFANQRLHFAPRPYTQVSCLLSGVSRHDLLQRQQVVLETTHVQ